MQILIVEDDAIVAHDVEETLRTTGVEVYVAANADDALSLAERTAFDLALLDVRLGYGESGLMLAEMLLERHAIPSLLVTGLGELPEHVGSYALGVLAKPFSPGDLVSAVQAVRSALTGQTVPAGPAGLTLFSGRDRS
ncbi:response regulator [Oleisolibacter albus]|uniref:response regulator n=1 Tax=Oleisolibacter albus TaxID=2171757 RepID=UPI000DF1D821|nr:response regulator [Oleisolibacter albus]